MSIAAQKNTPEPRSVRSVSLDEAAGIPRQQDSSPPRFPQRSADRYERRREVPPNRFAGDDASRAQPVDQSALQLVRRLVDRLAVVRQHVADADVDVVALREDVRIAFVRLCSLDSPTPLEVESVCDPQRRGVDVAELFEPDQRRIPVPLSDIPEPVQKAFVAAEDKRFFTHKGIDERGLIRAFIGKVMMDRTIAATAGRSTS